MKTFTEYLRDMCPDGMVLDDDLPDYFDSWLQKLDIDGLIELAETHGRIQYAEGEIAGMKEIREIVISHSKELIK